jgi:succinate dehydrogenase / fumarate reductase cytochrome b subunit
LFLAAWLIAAAMGKGSFEAVQWVYGSLIGRLILLGFSWALLHHMLGGIRHLIWDTGRGYGANERAMLARLTLIGSLVLTVLVWVAAYTVR